MIRINLLSVADHDRSRKRGSVAFDIGQKVTLVCSVILVATALAIGWWWWALDRQSVRLTNDIAAAERETARLKSIITQVEQFESQRQQLQQRVGLIEQLRTGQAAPAHMLDALSRALPEMLWLIDLQQKNDELTIQGRCTTLTALSDLVGNLERSGYFRRPVEIVDSQVETAPAGEAELIRFTLKATFAMPGAAPAPASSQARR